MYRVTIKSEDEKTAVIQGWGVVFGGEDLEGETFEKETDFELDLVPHKPIFYDHRGQDALKHALGIAQSVMLKEDTDAAGLWVEAQLDRSKAYVEEVLRLIKEGVLGWSSGSAGHLKSCCFIFSFPIPPRKSIRNFGRSPVSAANPHFLSPPDYVSNLGTHQWRKHRPNDHSLNGP